MSRTKHTGVTDVEVARADVVTAGRKCDAKKRMKGDGPWDGSRCGHPAGWGTGHVGVGRCRRHGGNSPQGRKHGALLLAQAEVERTKAAMTFFGKRIQIGPEEALLEEMQRSQGIVRWIEAMMADWGMVTDQRAMVAAADPAPDWTPDEIEAWEKKRAVYRDDPDSEAYKVRRRDWQDDELVESDGLTGLPQMVAVHYSATRIAFTDTEYAAWRKVYLEEREHLAKVAKLCIDAGIQERQQRVMEARAGMMAAVCTEFVRQAGIDMTPDRVRSVMQLAVQAVMLDSTRAS